MATFPFQTTDFPIFLAPMEAVTDAAFRRLCKSFGADVLISEFISSDALVRDIVDSQRKMLFEENERPFGIQIFGHNEESLRGAAEIAEACRPDFIDINWGCPVKKIVTKGAGAGILRDIPRMIELTSAVVKSVKVPVTVKTRLGWDESSKPIVEVAEMLQDIGIQMLTIHGRTRSQMYSGTADWTLIGKIKENTRMRIPIVGNGDINTGEKAKAYRERYGVDGVMIGRAAIGNPFIFTEIKKYLAGEEIPTFSYEKRVEICLKHLRDAVMVKGERTAVLEMRRHYAAYFRGVPNFKEKKVKLMLAQTLAECEAVFSNCQTA